MRNHNQMKTSSLSKIKSGVPILASNPYQKPKIAVVSWDLAHNPVGRAFLLADMAKRFGNVELIGAIHPAYGDELWPPLKSIDISIRSFRADDLKSFIKGAHELACNNLYDYVYVGKPRFPSLFLGFLIKHYSNCPLILDIDDHELSFFKNQSSASYKDLISDLQNQEEGELYSEIWTRFCENLIPCADAITVSNISLQQRYGGLIVRHARDEDQFNPVNFQRNKIRKEFGYTEADKVILFVGTPRPHKGIYRIAKALESIKDNKIVLCIIGTIRDKRILKDFEKYPNARIDFNPDQPWERLPELVSMADLACILQEPSSAISNYQIPAKLTDALAMGIPTIVSNVPPLQDLIASKCVISVNTDEELERSIKDIFYGSYNGNLAVSKIGRHYFLSEFSYCVNTERIKLSLEIAKSEYKKNPYIVSQVFELLEKRSSVKLPRLDVDLSQEDYTEEIEYKFSPDKPINIVFFWKQNDSGIYGRRQDMLLKQFSKSKRIGKIVHFDAPISIEELQKKTAKGPLSKFSQNNLVFINTVERFLEMQDTQNVFRRTFIYTEDKKGKDFLGFNLPQKSNYIEYIKQTLCCLQIDSNVMAWVCPVVFEFPEISKEIKFDFVVSDIIDDQRKWDVHPKYFKRLDDSYRQTLELSNIAFANCETTKSSFQKINPNITVVQNGAEIFDRTKVLQKPEELASLSGPIIGYVGNLSDRVDVDLMRYIAVSRKDWNLVVIGSAHGSSKIFELSSLENVHLLGVRPYDESLAFIQNFDVGIIPHLDNELTRSMNPLKLYVYYAMGIPIVSTPILNIDDLKGILKIASNYSAFVDSISEYLLDTMCSNENSTKYRTDLLDKISWENRLKTILNNIDTNYLKQSPVYHLSLSSCEQIRNQKNVVEQPNQKTSKSKPLKEEYHAVCNVCGTDQIFQKEQRSLREGYKCKNCNSSLRYRGQVEVILRIFSQKNSTTLVNLCKEESFRKLSIYEPGLIGPLRKYLSKLENYTQSSYQLNSKPGSYVNGVQIQDLQRLIYSDEKFDLVLSSDILQCVSQPSHALKEIQRVLRPGGYHIFSIPVTDPIPEKTTFTVKQKDGRVISSGGVTKDFQMHNTLEALSDRSVQFSYGEDLIKYLKSIGFKVSLFRLEKNDTDIHRLITFVAQKI